MIDFDATVLRANFDTFAGPIIYQPLGGQAVATRGIFEESLHELRADQDGALIDTAHPILGLRISELPFRLRLPQQNDRVQLLPAIGLRQALWNTVWSVKEAPGPDSAGHLKLGLMGPLSASAPAAAAVPQGFTLDVCRLG